MHILLVVPRQDQATGNWITARRLQRGLESRGHQIVIHESDPGGGPQLARLLATVPVQGALLLHAYRSGRPWLESGADPAIPFAVLLTGTDHNYGFEDPAQRAVLERILSRADAVFAQSRQALSEVALRLPQLNGRLRYLAPGVSLGQCAYDLRARHGISNKDVLFLCPAGLRPVKGVLGLLGLFDRVAHLQSGFRLAFCGPVLASQYGRRFQRALASRPWADYLGVIAPEAMAAAMQDADVVVNNSRAEGLSNALMEARALGVPILARDIPGNADVVTAGHNGLLYDGTAAFCRHARELIVSPELRRNLSHPIAPDALPKTETEELDAFFRHLEPRPLRPLSSI